jgi:S1-C subfamily serine protease
MATQLENTKPAEEVKTPTQTALPSKATVPTKIVKPRPKVNWLQNITLSIILLLVFALSTISFILVYPNNPASKLVVQNTPLQNVIKSDISSESSSQSQESQSNSQNSNNSTPNSSTGSGNNSSANSQKPQNNKNSQNQAFSFAPDSSSKTASSIIEENLPSVISIRVTNEADLRGFQTETAGTGYIVSEDGLVVTNKHVIAMMCKANNNKTQISGISFDRKDYKMDLLTVDPIDDIAILKIQNLTTKLNPVRFADSSKIKLGTDVLAIGNVLGQLQNTVTRGIISGLDRSLTTDLVDECTGAPVRPDGLIQTDAAINKGNSGGPLFDNSGALVGMNTFGTTEAQSVGLAITSNTVLTALNSFKQNGKIIRPRLGVSTEPLDPDLKAKYSWLPVDYGEIIYTDKNADPVSPNSPAAAAGLKKGEIILEVNGQKIISTSDNVLPLRKAILASKSDEEIELTVLKVATVEGNGFTYEQTPVKVKAKLGGISFDIPKTPIFTR